MSGLAASHTSTAPSAWGYSAFALALGAAAVWVLAAAVVVFAVVDGGSRAF